MANPHEKGPSHGRFTKTLRSLFGNNRSDLMPLSPADKTALGLGLSTLKYIKKVTRLSLAEQAKMAREQHRAQVSGIKRAAEQGISSMGGTMQERGILGSSVQEQARQGILSERDAQISGSFAERTQALMDIKQAKLDNIIQYRQGLTELAMQAAAARAQGSLDLYGGPTRNPSDYQLDTSATETSIHNSELSNLLAKLGAKLPWAGIDSNDYRSFEEQQALWNAALEKYGDPEIADNWVARPGTSNHERGWAVDIPREAQARFAQWVANHPYWSKRLFRPMDHEPWHWEVRPGYGGRPSG